MKRPHRFPRSHRLGGRSAFAQVFEARVRESRGPLTIYAVPNGLTHPRLGISIGRKFGTAPRRNRVKRLLREAFRLQQHDLPAGYDFVVVVRTHEPMTLADYQKLFTSLVLRLHAAWERRLSSRPGREA